MRLASISVDLDSLPHYCRIHGLAEALLDARAKDLIHTVAVPRLLELFSRLGVPATFFAIGEDLERPAAREAISRAHREGVEIASHSYRHDYRLSRLPPDEIREDLTRADRAIAEVRGGERPEGFRAPGYTLSPALLEAVGALGYRYDSSAFPSAPYYLAKAAVMGGLALAGRPSRSMLDSPRVLLAPREPYRPAPHAPYRRGEARVLELPMAVTPGLGFPFIGTFVVTLPRWAVRGLYRQLAGLELLNLELHAIDVLDAADGVPWVVARQQRDLQVPHRQKLARLEEVFSWLKDDFEVVTLAEAAARLWPSSPLQSAS